MRVVSRNVGCFLRLTKVIKVVIYLVYLRIIERTFSMIPISGLEQVIKADSSSRS